METGKKTQNRLDVDTSYGKLYICISLGVILLAILFITLVCLLKNNAFLYVLGGIGIAYCATLLVFEIKRTRGKKVESAPKEKAIAVEKNLYEYTDTITKMVICDYVCSKYDRMESVHRPNYTLPAPGLKAGLPLADTHYVSNKEERKCFMYVYQNDDNEVKILLKTSKEHFKQIKEEHPSAELSKFPKVRKGNSYYKLVIDSSYSRKQLFGIIDTALAIFLEK